MAKSSRDQNIPTPCESNGPLDYVISLDELKKAGDRLKQGKAHGIDMICNEIIEEEWLAYASIEHQ